MKGRFGRISILILLGFCGFTAYSQKLVSGEYGNGLKLGFDSVQNKLSGYYENYSGWDELTKAPRFSCNFYFETILAGDSLEINTYYPGEKTSNIIKGTLKLNSYNLLPIKLQEEHGGCWNVQHFADEPVNFELVKKQDWMQIRYVETAKTYIYSENSDNKKTNVYLVKNDVVCIQRIEGEWGYGTYYGDKKISKGWIRLSDLNLL